MLIDYEPNLRTTDGVAEVDKVPQDTEKASLPSIYQLSPGEVERTSSGVHILLERLTDFLTRHGIETRGIDPIPPEARTDSRLYQMFFVWFSPNMNVLGLGTGASGPAFFGLGVKETLIVLSIVDIIACAVPAYFAVFGPKLGMRSMVQARYSWGSYAVMLPAALNVFSMQGFLILNCIIGGQTLASVSSHLDDTLGIVIISLISMVVTFCGYRVIHWYESAAWIPNTLSFILMLGVGGKHLVNAPAAIPVTASTIITFATTIASSVITWCPMTPDYGVYHSEKASVMRVFLYTYLGFFVSSYTAHCLGAVFAASAPFTPSWEAGFDGGNNVGGLMAAVLSPLGGFGKFLVVVIALTIPSSLAPTMYTFTSSFMTISTFFSRIPRWVFIIISEGVLIPVAVVGATRFFTTFTDVINLIGYWSCVFGAIVLTEHFAIRRGDFTSYDLQIWDKAACLPPGIAALVAFLCAFAVIIPCMSQVWYTGPIAQSGTGDIGILGGSAVAIVLYIPLRRAEKAYTCR